MSIRYRNRQPIDEIKIDQWFVRNITTSPDHEVIVDTIIIMAQQLKLKVVAEGIETRDELDHLRGRRCDYYQGYYFAPPLPFDQFIQPDHENGVRHQL